MRLTYSQMRYILAIRILSEDGGGVRASDIAGFLGFSRPSVSGMLRALTKIGLLDRDRYGKIYFTGAGRAAAEELMRTAEELGRRLREALDLSSEAADDCALLLLAKLRERETPDRGRPRFRAMKADNTERTRRQHFITSALKSNENLFIYHDLIAAVVAAMEARDRYTASHSRRVSDISEQICRILGLPDEQTVLIHIAADLHDIGKIGVADSVLLREGPLEGDAWRVMKLHPVIGYEVLNKVEGFQEIALIVRHHHERWDGSGYPDGIKGQSIPFGSRIIAIADSIDAMMSDRPYRKKMSPEQCRQEIAKNKGVMYDPDIADAVLANWALIIDAGAY